MVSGTLIVNEPLGATDLKEIFSSFINRPDFEKIIKEENILPKNSLLNGAVKMDAENYYIQSGCMKKIELLIMELKIQSPTNR